MNWEAVITAWIIVLGIAIVGIFAIQTTSGLDHAFRRTAQVMFGIICVASDIFAVIAEFYHISFLWAILFAPVVCMIVMLLFFFYSSRKKRK